MPRTLAVLLAALVAGLHAPGAVGQTRGPVPVQTEDLQLVPARPAGNPTGWVAFDGETAVRRSTTTAWVFVREGAGWTEQAALPLECGSGALSSVAVSGDTLAALVGAPSAPEVHILVRRGTSWSTQQVLTSADVPRAWSVDLEGDTLVVGSTEDTPGGAWVFVRDGTTWSQQAVLVPSGATLEHQVERVALSGDTVVVDVGDLPPYTSPAPETLAAVFVRDGTSWSEQATLPSDGYTLALSGDTLLLTDRVFVRQGTRWSEQAVLVPATPTFIFGAIDGSALDGDVALVTGWEGPGAPTKMHAFHRSGTSWTPLALLQGSDLTTSTVFGRNARIVGDTVVTGAGPAAYVFTLDLPECYLVIGDAPGASPFVGGTHTFPTQVGPAVLESHAVLLDDIPAFALPTSSPGLAPLALARGSGAPAAPDPDAPAWMADGSFAVQVLMWNPEVFPQQPEQWSAGLLVTVTPQGHVVTGTYGASQGGLSVWAEVVPGDDGQPVVRFPFAIEGL